MPRSVFAKVVTIMLTMAICLIVITTIFFMVIVSPRLNQSFDTLLAEYARQVAASSPTLADAQRIASELHVDVRYEGPKGGWATNPRLPAVSEIRRPEPGDASSLLPRRRYQLAAAPAGGTYLFSWSLGGHVVEAHSAMLVALLVLIAGVIVAAHVVLRRLLDPLRALNTAVAQLGAGQLDVRVPIHTRDEFGRLTAAFNTMVERVREMIQSRDQLLVDVSHELRSPLTRMKVALELPSGEVQRGRLSDDVAEMERMVSELLELERLRMGQGLSVTRHDVVPILHNVASRYADRAPGVRVVTAEEHVVMDVDADRIRIVLRNLLENAIKYSLPDSRPVELRATMAADAVVVCVIDDGVGIPVADADRIFEPFFRVDPSRSKRTGGYGLGLSICKRIVEAHGGTILVERGSPRGSTFVLTFPRARSG